MRSIVIPILAPLTLGACLDRDVTAEQAVEAVATADLTALVAMAQQAAADIAALGDVETTGEDSSDGLGSCVWTQTLTGTALAGTVTFAPDALPCGGAATSTARTFTYDVTDAQVEGSWSTTRAGLTLELTGYRDAAATFSGPKAGDRAWDAALTLSELTATIADDAVTAWSIAGTWDAMGGRTWILEASADADGVSGTISVPRGTTCTVTGTLDAPVVSCTTGT